MNTIALLPMTLHIYFIGDAISTPMRESQIRIVDFPDISLVMGDEDATTGIIKQPKDCKEDLIIVSATFHP